ncbi:sensor histidine kinase [Nonomuraea jiangxiensis]|uniref:histidine kinase n=1 Tax=Nonomuraea jiangxiensis TaxID=633440 RepID=A0A1G9B375_9ACTN|nr:HAMP domain-containing sensor histidine kinase [Nonomuraea jiangxiensis]SDK33943.1 Signal transduction histidine kinase [Nonomuraea jiangxiensis]
MLSWYLPSFRARRTVATGVVAALVCAVVSVLFLMYTGNQAADAAQSRVTEAWNRVVPLIREGPLPSTLRKGRVEGIEVVDTKRRVVAATPELVGRPPIAAFSAPRGSVSAARVLCPPPGLTGCMTVVSYKVYQPQGAWLLYVAVPVVPWYGQTTAVLLAVGVSLLVTALMAAWVFRDLTKALAPVNAIRAELAEITATDLDRRVPVPTKYAEMKALAETVNDTLDRLEGAYARLRRFTADASHDLRTPITAMRTQLEEALLHQRDTDWPGMTRAVLAGVDRLQAVAADLLTLARLDAHAPIHRTPTDLSSMVEAELDRRTYQKKIIKDLPGPVCIDCDRMRITRVLVNLLDNAERHANSQIVVSVRADDTSVIMEVADDGEGIAAEHRELVFDRFTRLDAARSRDAGGTGLGLAIAREIARAHEGTLTIEDSERGARFVLRLPLCRTAQNGQPHSTGA